LQQVVAAVIACQVLVRTLAHDVHHPFARLRQDQVQAVA